MPLSTLSGQRVFVVDDEILIASALKMILRGAKLVATNLDPNCPTESGLRPGCGATVAMLETASGIKAFSVGKPSPVMLRSARKELGLTTDQTIVIGDTMETDILGGVQLGYHTILVLSGGTKRDDLPRYTYCPEVVVESLAEYAQMAGFGKKTGIDLPGEAEGLMPSSKWKLRTQREKWYAGETISVSIGQGAVTVTPLQLASAIGGIVSGGNWFKPHLVAAAAVAEPRHADFKPESIAAIVSGMYGVINEGGTGAAARIEGVEFSGKTGSAQRVSNDLRKSGLLDSDDDKDNGWFVGFAPRQNPEIVVAVLLEGGEHGALAAPVARDVIKSYFDKKLRMTQTSLQQAPLALLRIPRN